MNKPLISIIMNCYNGEKFINNSINSIINQTYQNWELIFWDNDSSDNTKSIYDTYHDARFKYYKSNKTILLYNARNEAVKKANGDFIAFLDVDDWWENIKLEKQIVLFRNKKIGLVCSNYWRVQDNNIGEKKLVFKNKIPSGNILNQLLMNNYIGMSTLIIRSEAYKALDYGFDSSYEIIGDYDLNLRLLEKWELGVCQEPLSYYRWHDENLSNKKIELHITELFKWHTQMKNYNPMSVCNNFNYILDLANYMEIKNDMEKGIKKFFFIKIFKIKNIKLKLKIIAIAITPKIIINILKS